MSDVPNYQPIVQPAQPTAVERSMARDDAFSKPGSIGKGTQSKSKGWKPAHGTRFRATHEKVKGRRRKRAKDDRNVTFY